MGKTKTENERVEMLKSLGLNPEAPALTTQKKASHEARKADSDGVTLAPPGVDPHLMPVDEIHFDPRLLDGYTSLAFNQQGNEAARYIFSLYKSYGRDKERNGALQRAITKFITNTRRNRETGGMVREEIKSTAEQRDLAALIASQGITAADLAALLKSKEAEG